MLKELEQQISDIQAGATKDLSLEYGHAVSVIAEAGRNVALYGEGTEEAQIEVMRERATKMVIKYGPKIPDYLKLELRALIQPKDLEQLEQEHQLYLAARDE